MLWLENKNGSNSAVTVIISQTHVFYSQGRNLRGGGDMGGWGVTPPPPKKIRIIWIGRANHLDGRAIKYFK